MKAMNTLPDFHFNKQIRYRPGEFRCPYCWLNSLKHVAFSVSAMWECVGGDELPRRSDPPAM
jgi:hypothetical protein